MILILLFSLFLLGDSFFDPFAHLRGVPDYQGVPLVPGYPGILGLSGVRGGSPIPAYRYDSNEDLLKFLLTPRQKLPNNPIKNKITKTATALIKESSNKNITPKLTKTAITPIVVSAAKNVKPKPVVLQQPNINLEPVFPQLPHVFQTPVVPVREGLEADGVVAVGQDDLREALPQAEYLKMNIEKLLEEVNKKIAEQTFTSLPGTPPESSFTFTGLNKVKVSDAPAPPEPIIFSIQTDPAREIIAILYKIGPVEAKNMDGSAVIATFNVEGFFEIRNSLEADNTRLAYISNFRFSGPNSAFFVVPTDPAALATFSDVVSKIQTEFDNHNFGNILEMKLMELIATADFQAVFKSIPPTVGRF